MAAIALEALPVPLDRSLLYVFVAGPGYGEGIAVALPGAGWILVDGCEVSSHRLPILAVLDRWRASPASPDPIDALLLTHPHTDHAYGIRELIEQTSPRHIGVTTSATEPALIFSAIEKATLASDPLDRLRRRIVVDAMLAIRRRFEAAPAHLIPLVEGATVPLTSSPARAFIRAPDRDVVHARLSGGHGGDPNELSAVVEIVFGATRLVLGSDLPTVGSSGGVLAAGWNTVMARHPYLGAHHGLKIPHHGSPAAFHPELMTAGTERAWWVSPFNRGKRLPPTEPDGLPRLVSLNGRVRLTAIPRSRRTQPHHAEPAEIPLSALPALFAPMSPLLPGALSVVPPDVEPLDPIWCGAFDDQGTMRGAWRGTRAFTVIA